MEVGSRLGLSKIVGRHSIDFHFHKDDDKLRSNRYRQSRDISFIPLLIYDDDTNSFQCHFTLVYRAPVFFDY